MPRVVLFRGIDAAGADGLWVADGTASGTAELAVAGTGPNGLAPSGFTSLGGKVLFSGAGPTGYPDLWVTDGTASGTARLAVAGAQVGGGPNPFSGFNPGDFTSLGGKVLFSGTDAAGRGGLWVTDGTATGTTELTVAGASSSGLLLPNFRHDLAALGGKVLFSGEDATNHSGLWVTDGTAAGTMELPVAGAATGSGSGGLIPSNFAPLGGRLLFAGFDASGKGGLWATDGTAAGTVELFGGSAPDLQPQGFAPLGGKLLFRGFDASGRAGLWVTDGTAAGTVELPVAGGGTFSTGHGLDPQLITSFGDKALFNGTDAGNNSGLWVTDGTGTGTAELAVAGAATFGVNPVGIANLGGKALFNGNDAASHRGLWVTDGTAAGTAELGVAGVGANGLNPTGITVLDGKALFNGTDASGKVGLWVTDGTASGTTELTVAGAASYSYGLNPVNLAAVDIATPAVAYTDTATGASATAASSLYTGPVSYLHYQYIWSGADGVAMATMAADVFLHGGAGDDALTAAAGSNVLDGGSGSNFLTGSTGADGGTDTFFVDGRSGGVTWSTVSNFHHGDAITVWGFTSGTSTGFDAATGQGSFAFDGAAGHQGATIHSELGGAGTGVNASLTIAGMSVADAASKLTLSAGSVGGNAYLYVAYTG